jgi:hypothetical protein
VLVSGDVPAWAGLPVQTDRHAASREDLCGIPAYPSKTCNNM